MKKLEDNYYNNRYRNNFNKFKLPELIEKAPIILKKKIDTSPFKRVKY